MKHKKTFRSLAVLLVLALSMTTFTTVAYAGGGDYYDSELPPAENTEPEETAPPEETTEPTEPVTITPGAPFTEDGIAATRDLLYDKHTNKQFIVVETRSGNTFYIVIDYDKLLDEEEERYCGTKRGTTRTNLRGKETVRFPFPICQLKLWSSFPSVTSTL